jgi:hypothetical protein
VNSAKDLESLCLRIYQETQKSEAIRTYCDQYGGGFEVLMGPPLVRPDIAFIGYQPGDWELSVEAAREAGYEKWWVKGACHYATEDWRLARRLRAMFSANRLRRCVGLNAIFVRAKSTAAYRATPRDLRNRIRAYCLPQLQRMLEAMQPERIVVIGFETMDLFGRSSRHDIGSTKTLVKLGKVFGRPAVATPHLSAAWGLSNEDLLKISRIVLA